MAEAESYLDLFKDQSYAGDEDFQRIIAGYEDMAKRFNVSKENRDPTFQQVSGYADTFRQQFKNYVGRDPNSQEFNQFFKSLATDSPWAQEAGGFAVKQREATKGLIKDYFTSTAADEAERRAREQTTTALAPGSAFDQWANSYRGSLSETEKSLQDYQSRLFEKLRPQLLTSLKSQGLLDSGALNTAFAGAAKDLGQASTDFLTSAKMGVEQDIGNRKYAIQSAPGDFALQNTFNTVPNLQGAGQAALNNVFSSYMQDQQFKHQMQMMERQMGDKPSPLSQYGGLIVGGIAGGLPGAFASYAASRANARTT